jgi:hypothetical protein
MIGTEFYIVFCIVIIIVFSLGFNDKWATKTFAKIKDNESTWYWFKIFKINETQENYFKFSRILSAIVIVFMILNIIWLFIKSR